MHSNWCSSTAGFCRQSAANQAVDSVLYGLNGRVVRVALPQLVPQKTQVPSRYGESYPGTKGARVTVRTELVQNVTALADKALSERMPESPSRQWPVRRLSLHGRRGDERGSTCGGERCGSVGGLLVGLLAKGLAVASEEADKRSWQTLPDEIHLARVWVPPGRYQVQSQRRRSS